jgi:arylsulfatase A-like enzyme
MFPRCYAANPARGPSLAALITGRYPHACGVLRDGQAIRPGQPSLLRQLEAAGYVTEWIREPGRRVERATGKPFFLVIEDEGPFAVGLLERLPLDTLVVFHALPSTTAPDGFKEPSVRAPLFMRWLGGQRRGAVDDLLLSSVDLMPTLLAICGAEIPAAVQGRNLAAAMQSGEGDRPEAIYSYGLLGEPGEWRMVVRGLDKLVVNAKLETTHLFNLGQDPGEQHNLALEAGSGRNRDELKAHLRAWMKKLGDGVDPSSGLKLR